jgi:glycosyltransferase involved in cell wall biosynthesis
MKRICFVVAAFSYGGVNRMTANLAREFLDAGYGVDVVALEPGPDQTRYLFDSRVRLFAFQPPRVRAVVPLWRHFMEHRDYVAVISAVDFVNVFTILAHRLSGQRSKLICTVRTDLRYELEHNYTRRLDAVLKLASKLYGFADAIVAVSEGTAEGLRAVLGKPTLPVTVIYNPAAKVLPPSYAPPAPHAWLTGQEPVLVSCGRLTKQKDFELLIDAFRQVRQTHPAKLLIIGEGEERTNLEHKIATLGLDDCVALVGHVEHPEEYMAHARLFVLASLWEGFGNVLVEALSVGCPIVAMDCPSGVAEILGHGQWGRLVRERSPSVLASAITDELRGEHAPRDALKERSARFRPERIAREYLALADEQHARA